MNKLFITAIILVLIFAGPILIIAKGKIDFKADYRTANRNSVKIAPNPTDHKEAIIQAYSARAFNWRGAFAVHTWIAVKPHNAEDYVVYQVMGWKVYSGLSAVDARKDIPDRSWYGQKPEIILDIRGKKAQEIMDKIDKAVNSYPRAEEYGLWPGANSNSFIAYIARQVPDLGLALPSNAIGKDFLISSKFFAKAPSATGYQFSLFGLLGILIAKKEGIEINILGLVYGIKFSPFKLLFPGF
ncbi:MAG: hypothetical protein ACJA02_000889 [Myxococcota bacterium]|jgi:uncharacterized protein YxeA